MVRLIAPAQYTWFVRGSTPEHPNAIDFGFRTSFPGSETQPLYAGVLDALEVKLERKRYAEDGGNIVDIRIETETNTMFLSFMHMLNPSPLPVGSSLTWGTIVGNMGNTGSSTGNHVHVILAVCPKGTPVENMYSYRVDPKPYYYYLEDWTNSADNELPWTTLDSEHLRQLKYGDVLTFKNSNGERVNVMKDQTYKVTKITGNKVELELIGEETSMVGKQVTIQAKTTLYNSKGQAYPSKTTQQHTVTISEDLGDLLGFSASWLVGVNKAYIKRK